MTTKLFWWLAVVMAVVGTGGAQADDNITINADTPWLIPANQPEPVQRALEDVQRDWYKVFGHRPVVLAQVPEKWTGSVIRFEPADGKPESFSLRVDGKTLVVAGAGKRGLIYAAYALAEEILGVDPWYFWTDHEPTPRQQIEVPGNFKKTFGPPTFRYRGWFINDEDLLGGFSPDPLRENVYSMEMLERICETILRLRGNMIVPGTFNFPDERCWELASRRGLALSMHHVSVVGLNTHRWPKDVPFSYTKHPDIMERYWRDSIAAYQGREVVWTVGYRGKQDQPFWVDEPEINTPVARGAVITKAIAKQVELIREADPKATIIANLWMEGAEMMRDGFLKLPPGVIEVWPDDGSGKILDNGAVRAGQGVYYHTAMLSRRGNQLSEAVPPARIYGELGRFAGAGATSYFLLNTSDVRPVPLTTDCAMRFAWNASGQKNQTDFLRDWSRREFGAVVANEVADIYARYFGIPYLGEKTRQGERHLHVMLSNLAGTKSVPEARQAQTFAITHHAYVAELFAAAAALAKKIPVDRQGFYQSHVLTPIELHLRSLEMLEGYSSALIDRDPKKAEQALRAADAIFAALHRAETGKWSAWYFGERFVDLETNRYRVRVLLAELRGEPPPPPLPPTYGYYDLYKYQHPFKANFPRLYPH